MIRSLVSSAIGFIPMVLTERGRPHAPLPISVLWQDDKSSYHNYKNFMTESVRQDAQWWSKCLCFTTFLATILALIGWIL